MHIDRELVDEIILLRRFGMGGPVAMDIHENSDPAVIAAAARMYEKGLITSVDGGAFTDSGRKAAHHLDQLMSLLDPPLEPI